MTQLQKNKLELIGQKTYKNIQNVLTIKGEKSLVWDQPLRYTSVQNPTNCFNMESQLKRKGNLLFSHACIHQVRSLVIMNEKTLRTREAVMKRNKEVSNKTVKYFRQQNKCSQYLVGKRVLLRLSKKGKIVSKKYYVVLVKITKIEKHGDNYKVIFKNPVTKAETAEWFSVEDLADLRKTSKNGKDWNSEWKI